MRCDEAQELITARVDNELSAEEKVAIDAHLQSCADCSRVYEQESLLKRQIHIAAQRITAPAQLRRAIEAKSASVEEEHSTRRLLAWFYAPAWRPALAATILLLIVASLVYIRWPAQNIGVVALEALETHASILSGKIALVRSNDPAELRRALTRAVSDRFEPVAFDLSMMNLYPVAGFVRKIAGRDVLVTVYQGTGPAITCFTYLGSDADAPEGADRFYDADLKVNFYSFSRADVNGVLHREGEVICVLVSKLAPADLLALVRGKSVHA